MSNKKDTDSDYSPCTTDNTDIDTDESSSYYEFPEDIVNKKTKKRKLNNLEYDSSILNPTINLALVNLPNDLFFNLSKMKKDDYYDIENSSNLDTEIEGEYEEKNDGNHEVIQKITSLKKQIDEINGVRDGCELSIIDKVILSKLDIKIKADIVYKLENQNTENSDKNKLYSWVNQVLKLPIGVYKNIIDNENKFDINTFLLNARNKLDKAVYGMENTKEEIIDFLVRYLTDPENSGTVLGLKGSKGVGKTKLCRALSDILNLPFFQISLGGIADSSSLLGFDSTYVGAKCGKIASFAQQAKCMNFVLYIDELDKSSSFKGNEVHGVLTHLFDETQNKEFQDLYFEGVPLDLSKVLFIASFNDEDKIDPIVLNRMKVIEIKDLNLEDKITIVKNYILPEINYNNINFTDDIINYIIKIKTKPEKGMRNIKKNIETIVNRMNTITLLKYCKNQDKIVYGFSYKDLVKNSEEINYKFIDILLNGNQFSNSISNEILHSLYI